MHKLEDFKDEINKCSKCGLCQSICPIYKLTGNDCAVSRGKFVMLDGVLKGDLKLNKNINKYLDMCLKCGKCKDFCPSSIDVCKILETAKYEYAKNTFWGNFVFFLESKLVFGTLSHVLKNILCHAEFVSASQILKQVQDDNFTKIKLLYFKGCVNTIFPQTDKLLHKLFDNSNVEIIEKDFDCCGLPFLSSGNLERFEEVKKHNLALMDRDFDYILTDCASCESTLKGYFNEITTSAMPPRNDRSLRANEKSVAIPSFISLGELVANQNIKFKFKKPIKVTFHKPCHLADDGFLLKIIENCENVEYVEMKDYDECCGFAGEFALKNHKLSSEISKQKALNTINTGADYCVTTCPACILGLKQGLFGMKNAPKVLSLSQFLSLAQVISQAH